METHEGGNGAGGRMDRSRPSPGLTSKQMIVSTKSSIESRNKASMLEYDLYMSGNDLY